MMMQWYSSFSHVFPSLSTSAMLCTSALLLVVLLPVPHAAQAQPAYPRMGSHSHMNKNAHHQHKGHSHHKVKIPDSEKPSIDGGMTKPKKFTKDKDLIRDKEHIKEELGEFLQEKDVAQMSPYELEFHYFRLHDTDDNRKLDGLELLAALLHVHGEDDDDDNDGEEVDEDAKIAEFRASPDDTQEMKEEKRRKAGEFYRQKSEKRRKEMEAFKFYTKMIDEVLEEDDWNHDGFLSYIEFAASRRRDDDESAEKKDTEYSWFDF